MTVIMLLERKPAQLCVEMPFYRIGQFTFDQLALRRAPEEKAWFREQADKWKELSLKQRAAKRAEWKAGADKLKENWENLTPEQQAWWSKQGKAWSSNWADKLERGGSS